MDYTEGCNALILLKATQEIVSKRRKLEMKCGYPSEYGGDALLLRRINEFLASPNIEHELKEAIEFAKKLE